MATLIIWSFNITFKLYMFLIWMSKLIQITCKLLRVYVNTVELVLLQPNKIWLVFRQICALFGFGTLDRHHLHIPWQRIACKLKRIDLIMCIQSRFYRCEVKNLRFVSINFKYNTNLSFVWKHECSDVKNGWFADKARIRFSVIVHSTSSSWIITSFLRTLMAKISFESTFSANMTFPKEPFPRTLRNLKSSKEHFLPPPCLFTISSRVVTVEKCKDFNKSH